MGKNIKSVAASLGKSQVYISSVAKGLGLRPDSYRGPWNLSDDDVMKIVSKISRKNDSPALKVAKAAGISKQRVIRISSYYGIGVTSRHASELVSYAASIIATGFYTRKGIRHLVNLRSRKLSNG
jgi:hypothetical protein